MIKRREISKMRSYLMVILTHVIKIHAEKRTTNSWEGSIYNAIIGILRLNVNKIDFELELNSLWEDAIEFASCEVKGGLEINDLENLVKQQLVVLHCLSLLNLAKRLL